MAQIVDLITTVVLARLPVQDRVFLMEAVQKGQVLGQHPEVLEAVVAAVVNEAINNL